MILVCNTESGTPGKKGLTRSATISGAVGGEPLLRVVEAAHEAVDDFGLLVDEGGGCGE